MGKSKIYQALLTILEAPNSKKGYLMLRKCYENMGRKSESDAIKKLITERFGNDDNYPHDFREE